MCCGGRLDLHGAPLNRSWVKLGETHYPGESQIVLAEPVTGWNAGNQITIPTTEGSPFYTEDKDGRRIIASVADNSQTEQHEISNVRGSVLTLKKPLKFKHEAVGRFRGEVANLSRNVIVESADPDGVRGHTMYHHNSAGSLSHVEFRHLGKEGVLGRYPIHFHQCGDTMRGSSVVGCSIWDSKNRWLTIHGTDYLVVRDCVGFRSIGHGFFFEDGTEVNNVMDRNLAVQALMGKPLPEQNLPFDTNDAAGFWWANCQNSFTRNVAVECDKHGYRFQMVKTDTFDPELRVRQVDGKLKKVDVRTLPFIRFEGNEARSQRRFALNLGGFHGQSTTEDLDRDGNVIDRVAYLGGDVQGVGPDALHPFRIKDFLVWRSHWAFHSTAPNVVIDGFTAHDINYVVWRSNIAGHDYNHVDFQNIHVSTFFNNWGSGNNRSDLLRYVDPVDDFHPSSVITGVDWLTPYTARVSGVSVDDVRVKQVTVNGIPAELQDGPVTTWVAVLASPALSGVFEAKAVDENGNAETTGHRLAYTRPLQSKRISQPKPTAASQAAPPVSELTAPTEVQPPVERDQPVNTSGLKWPLWDGRQPVSEYAKLVKLPAKKTIELHGIPLELKLIPAGSFLMGSPSDEVGRSTDESPRHRVVISEPFYLSSGEITQALYEKVMGVNPSHFKAPDKPVEQVTWHDAIAFIKASGAPLRLPTEAQWEYACRAGITTAYSSGTTQQSALQAGWFGYGDELNRALSDDESHPSAQKEPNGFGLYDMHGNVYEWCADWYSPTYYKDSPTMDPQGPPTGDERVLRGGSWEAPAVNARSANRNGYSPNSRGYVLGFRVALSVDSSP